MIWIILFASITLLLWSDAKLYTSRIVIAEDIEKDEDEENTYTCRFNFNGRKCYGYFTSKGKLDDTVVLRVVGKDCTGDIWELAVMGEDDNDKDKSTTK